MEFNLRSIERSANEDRILDITKWGEVHIHNKGTILIKNLGNCIITFTNNKIMMEDILKNTDITLNDLEENYIYYGNYLWIPKDNMKNKFTQQIENIIQNIRISDYWLDIIGVQ